VVYYICRRIYGEAENEKLDAYVLQEELPGDAERASMDREYRIWKTVVIAACVVAGVLYLIPLL
jgi:APA family basic amino acid/polyamine antiporter